MSLIEKIWLVLYGITFLLSIRTVIIGVSITNIKLKEESEEQRKNRLHIGWIFTLLGILGFVYTGSILLSMVQLWW